MREEQVKKLLEEYLVGNLNAEGRAKLAELLSNQEYREEVFSIIEKDYQEERFISEENNEIKEAIHRFLAQQINEGQTHRKVIPIKKWAVAASVLGLLFLGWWLFKISFSSPSDQPVAKKIIHSAPADISPGRNGAILTLSNGKKIILDSTQGSVASEGKAEIKNANGTLLYDTHDIPGDAVYNTMTTPNGRQYQIVLSDGTRAWLNASSSITFPTVFNGKERRVKITGEVFFEVAHDASKPFFVSAGNMDIQVYGTEFNVNSYNDEPNIKTTLVRGSVKIIKDDQFAFIKPGEQATVFNNSSSIKVSDNVDMENVLAWKEGKFIFQDADIKTIMRQLQRWYNVRVTYMDNVTGEEFIGMISRNVNISQILKMLEKTGKVSFEVNGQNIVVK